MVQNIKLTLINEKLHIGMANWRDVYLLYPNIVQLKPEVERGRLVYRSKGSNNRFSYDVIKKDLIKKDLIIQINYPDWVI